MKAISRPALPGVDEMVAQTISQYERGQVHDPDFPILKKFIRADTDVLDVGANRGQSVASLRLISRDCRIHSFEANTMLHPVMEKIAKLYAVTFHGFGLGDADAAIPLYIPWASGECYLEEASTRKDYFELPWVAEKFIARGGLELETIEISIRVGDDLQLHPSLIKVDVEGAEFRVLKGLRRTLQKYQPALLVENSDYHNVTEFLQAAGYSPFMISGDTFSPSTEARINTLYLSDSQARIA